MTGIEDLLLRELSYAGMSLSLIGSGLVLPVPEELIILTGGYFTAKGLLSAHIGIPLCIASLLIGDSILFYLARIGSNYATGIHDRFVKLGLERTWVFSPDHPLRAVFIMRFITGLRMIAPVYAGLNRASWGPFLLVDFIALCIYIPIVYYLGMRYHESFLLFVAGFEVARHVFFWGLLAIVGGGVFAAWHERFRARFRKPDHE